MSPNNPAALQTIVHLIIKDFYFARKWERFQLGFWIKLKYFSITYRCEKLKQNWKGFLPHRHYQNIRSINGMFIKIPRRHSFKMLSTELISAFSVFLCVCQRTTIDHGTVKSWHFALTSNGKRELLIFALSYASLPESRCNRNSNLLLK